MIWLTKLLQNIDGFYTQATGDVNFAETPEEARARRRAKLLADREEAKKAVEDLKKEQEIQETNESAGRAALEKLNGWEVPDPLYEEYKNFMSVYVKIFTLIDELKPDIVKNKLDAAIGELDQMAPTEDEKEKQIQTFEDELESLGEKQEALAQMIVRSLDKALQRLLNNPYLKQSKSIETATKELNGEESKDSPMWQDWGFSSLEYIRTIEALANDAASTAISALGGAAAVATLVMAANSADEERRTFQEGEGVGKAIQEGLAPGQNKQQAVNAAVRRYRANCREAVRFAKNNNFHEHIESAIKVAEQRQRYEAALKADPIRYKKQLKLDAQRSQRLRDRINKLTGIAEAWAIAKTPQEKAEIKRRNKSLYLDKIYARGLDYDSLREAEVMLDADKLMAKTIQSAANYSETKIERKETVNTKIQERKLNRGLIDLATTILGQKIATRPSELKRSQSVKKQFEMKLQEFETTQFAKYKRDIELAHEKVMRATTAMAKIDAEMQLNNAKANLVKAQLALKDQLDPVQKIKEHLDKLKTIQKMVKALIKAGIIDNTSLLKPDQAPLVKQVVDQCRQLLSEYPFQDKVEAIVTQELLDKLAELTDENQSPDVETDESIPTEIDLTEKLSSFNTGIIMNKKSRKKILEKIEKHALQQTSFMSVMNKVAPVDMNLSSKEYAKQVYHAVSHAVAETIDDDFDRLIQELETDNQ